MKSGHPERLPPSGHKDLKVLALRSVTDSTARGFCRACRAFGSSLHHDASNKEAPPVKALIEYCV